MDRDELLLAITRCPELARARALRTGPCSEIAGIQSKREYHVPEPWSGHIDTAPILFISSNPSISESEHFPTPSWDPATTADYFQRRFDAGSGHVAEDQFRKVRFWTGVRGRAGELLGRKAIQGQDFAITELVHCKSRSEFGVAQALSVCTRNWLPAVMGQSAASVLVLVGKHARQYCIRSWGLDQSRSIHFDVVLGGRKRSVISIPHPNAFGPKKISDHASDDDLERLRSRLRY
jgi:hypothetical protein